MKSMSHLRRQQKGLTLIELLLVLVVVLAIAVVGFIMFGQTAANQRAQAGQQALLSVSSGIKSMANGPNYTGITSAVLIQAGKAPPNLVNGTTLNNPWGGTITVLSKNVNGGSNNGFMVCMNQVPRSECNSVVASTAGSFAMISAGTTACPATTTLPSAGVVKDQFASTPVNPTAATIATACDQENNTIVWIGT
jgi:prepilin-type N-terminal cleavage/methylation domain-containing protein